MNSLQVIFALGLIVIVSSLPIEFTHGNGDLKLTINDIFSEINDVLKRDLNEQLNKDAIDFGDKVNTTTHDGGKLQVQVQHFNAANGFPVFFNSHDEEILNDKKVSQVVDKVDEHATETSTSVTFSTSKSSSAPVSDVSKATESASTTTKTHSASSLESVSTSTVGPIITIVLPEKVLDSITKAPIKTRSLEQTVSTTSAIPTTTTRLSSSVAGNVSTSSAAPATTTTTSSSSVSGNVSTSSAAPAITTTSQAKVSEVSTESVSTTTAVPTTTTTTTLAPTSTTSGNIFLEAFDSFASLFQSKPDPVPTTTHAPITTTTVVPTTSSGSVSTSSKQSDVAEVPTSSNSPITQIVELKKDIAAVPVIFTQV